VILEIWTGFNKIEPETEKGRNFNTIFTLAKMTAAPGRQQVAHGLIE
jgi:hypothetical protein